MGFPAVSELLKLGDRIRGTLGAYRPSEMRSLFKRARRGLRRVPFQGSPLILPRISP